MIQITALLLNSEDAQEAMQNMDQSILFGVPVQVTLRS